MTNVHHLIKTIRSKWSIILAVFITLIAFVVTVVPSWMANEQLAHIQEQLDTCPSEALEELHSMSQPSSASTLSHKAWLEVRAMYLCKMPFYSDSLLNAAERYAKSKQSLSQLYYLKGKYYMEFHQSQKAENCF